MAGSETGGLTTEFVYRNLSMGAVALSLGSGLLPAAQAATFTVTNLNDAGAGSLRQAIEDANGAAGADVIDFQAGLTGTIMLTTGQLSITDSVDIQGPGAADLSVSGNNSSRVFYLYNGSSVLDVTMSGLTITNGSANIGAGIIDFDENLTLDGVAISGNASTGDGAGLWADGFNMNLTIRNSVLSGNVSGDDGGGIYIEDTGGPLLIENTVVSGNTAADKGGGIYFYDPDDDLITRDSTIVGNSAGNLGGGVYLYSPDSGVVTVERSTISGNTAASGGGVYFYSPDHGMVIENTTVSGNTASGAGGGIVLYNLYNGALRHSTIADNTAGTASGAGMDLNADTLVVENTVIANNLAAGSGSDLGGGGTFDATYSLIRDVAGANVTDSGGNVFNTDPQLGPLQDNGGTTFTHMPGGLASPLINAGDPAFVAPPSVDQRGAPRVSDGRVDIGAVERADSAVQFDAATLSVAEDGASILVTVTRSDTFGAASVDYATSDAGATAGADYTATAGTLNFADGQASASFSVPILDDALLEGDENFQVDLSNPSANLRLGTPAQVVVTITDVEAGTVQLDSATYSVAESAGTLTVTVDRINGSDGAVSVDYATTNGSATAGADYSASAGTLSFADGQTSASFNVPILDDGLVEADETFTVSLSNPMGGAALGTPVMATATILDDEVAGTLAFVDASASVTESAGVLTVSVQRSGGSDGAVQVDFGTSDGSALSPADFTAVLGSLMWVDGESGIKTFNIPIANDGIDEPDEAFTVILSNVQGGAALGSATLPVTIINSASAPAAIPAPQVIPASDQPARGLLALLVAFAAWFGLRRRSGGALGLALLAATLFAGDITSAEAAPKAVRATPVFAVGTVVSVDGRSGLTSLQLVGGKALSIAPQHVSVTDRRIDRASVGGVKRLADLVAGQVVLVKYRVGDASEYKLWLYSSEIEANAEMARKQERRQHEADRR